MSQSDSIYSVTVHHDAGDLPLDVFAAFHEHPDTSNILYAHADKALKSPPTNEPNVTGDLWVVWWVTPLNGTPPSVAVVLSCTTGPQGAYPIFLFTPLPSSYFSGDFVRTGILAIVRALRMNVPPERVFSVFAIDVLADQFANIWIAETGISLSDNPVYYHASLMRCNKNTLQTRHLPPLLGVETVLRLAVVSDVTKAAALCHGFAATSEPFVLTCEEAMQEAQHLVQNQQLWIHEVRAPGKEPEIASIVAVTRSAGTVAAITKVFTNPEWRSRGCAERLTRYVCQHLLESEETVVLYVAHSNPAAAAVYKHIGFVDLSVYAEDRAVNSWKELGFDRSKVKLGHW